MKIFLAGAKSDDLKAIGMKANVLHSFAYLKADSIMDMSMFKEFILDSGAFTFAFSKSVEGKVDWSKYCSNYVQFIKANKVKNWIELDIDKLVGYDKVKQMRTWMEKETGSQCMPVWHVNRGLDDFKKTCESHKFIAVGGIRQEIGSSRFPLMQKLIDEAHRHGTRIHGLGFTRMQYIEKRQCMFDTVDSTSWLNCAKFFELQRFTGTTIEKVKTPHGKTLNLPQNRRRDLGLREWVKFANYIEVETEHHAW